MVFIDPANKNINNVKLSKLAKNKYSKQKKISLDSINEAATTDSDNTVNAVQQLLFLQETDSYEENYKQFKNSSTILMQGLNQIRLELTYGNLTITEMINLKQNLTKIDQNFPNVKMQELMDEIILRVEVEIAKFDMLEKL